MKILDSRAAVNVQPHLISIVASHEKGDAALLRESEYLLEAAAIYNTQLENGGGIDALQLQEGTEIPVAKEPFLCRIYFLPRSSF